MIMNNTNNSKAPTKVGIVGGGVAGATIALRLAEIGIDVVLFEEGTSLVNGPPICHLHAGGNLYREISDQQCLDLLKQSIDTLRVFSHTANVRPTVIAVPTRDDGEPDALIPRLKLLQQRYQCLVKDDVRNKVLGEPCDYFKLYDQATLTMLASKALPTVPSTLDDWMIPVAKNLNLDEFKYPLVLVQEYGLSVFRIAATASLALSKLPTCHVLTGAKVNHLEQNTSTQQWDIHYQRFNTKLKDWVADIEQVDYLINACGYRTGTLDNIAQLPRERMVEFKAAYVTHWENSQGTWPEVIFHGERGTPNGMAQLTPYPDGYFQLHGMTEDITLFNKGLVHSTSTNAQPELGAPFIKKLTQTWQQEEVELRSSRAINHMSQFVPAFSTATVGGKPLFGAQQIPGQDASLRAADISFDGINYARTEIVKASSALSAADAVVEKLQSLELIAKRESCSLEADFPVTQNLTLTQVEGFAEALAEQRQYPSALARRVAF
ncbi:FAD-dependent oxidoreductase [Photobacterium kagoshimensis]|uniref:FAD-dependent oxidoreductase n=1 Tax=Photobacterium kagoshimensis TaxID=2910242 RepID=UPI003D0D6370